MKINLEGYPGHVIIDDNTGRLLMVVVGEGKKYDFRAICSHSNEGDKHYAIKL